MYKIMGADGKTYGPVSQEQIRSWLSQRRITGQTQVQADGSKEWQPLAAIPEFAEIIGGPESAAEILAQTEATETHQESGSAKRLGPKLALIGGGVLLLLAIVVWALSRKN